MGGLRRRGRALPAWGCLTLLLGFVLGASSTLLWWPRLPSGTVRAEPWDLRVTITDAYLARLVGRRVAGDTLPRIRNVRIRSSPPAALLTDADLSVGPLEAPGTLELQPIAAGGKVRVRIIAARLAGIPVPSLLTGSLEGAIDTAAARATGSSVRVIGVRVTADGLELLVASP
jgi:hypothetical protein